MNPCKRHEAMIYEVKHSKQKKYSVLILERVYRLIPTPLYKIIM